jgi:hypothetical protein
MLVRSLQKRNAGGAVMKSLPIKSGLTKSIMMLGGIFVGVRIVIALLEEVALLLAYYLA